MMNILGMLQDFASVFSRGNKIEMPQEMGIMNRKYPNVTPAEPLPHITACHTKEEMLRRIDEVMRQARPRMGLSQYTEAEITLQYACWDEWINATPGFAVTRNRLCSDEITIEQAVIDVNRCLDLFNVLT